MKMTGHGCDFVVENRDARFQFRHWEDKMVKNRRVALIDVDGTLVDNVEFEESVTKFIVKYITALKSVPISIARQLWEKSLSRERNSVKWYDYDQHCSNVGIPTISVEAHKKAIDRLHEVPGARSTWNLLVKYFAEVYVVSEAPRWVAELKLSTLQFSGYAGIVSSQDVGEPKSSATFWLRLKTLFLDRSLTLIIDNKICNLVGASASMGKWKYIFFDRSEHSVTLPERVRPINSAQCRLPKGIYIVHDHYELQELMRHKFGVGQHGKK